MSRQDARIERERLGALRADDLIREAVDRAWARVASRSDTALTCDDALSDPPTVHPDVLPEVP